MSNNDNNQTSKQRPSRDCGYGQECLFDPMVPRILHPPLRVIDKAVSNLIDRANPKTLVKLLTRDDSAFPKTRRSISKIIVKFGIEEIRNPTILPPYHPTCPQYRPTGSTSQGTEAPSQAILRTLRATRR